MSARPPFPPLRPNERLVLTLLTQSPLTYPALERRATWLTRQVLQNIVSKLLDRGLVTIDLTTGVLAAAPAADQAVQS